MTEKAKLERMRKDILDRVDKFNSSTRQLETFQYATSASVLSSFYEILTGQSIFSLSDVLYDPNHPKSQMCYQQGLKEQKYLVNQENVNLERVKYSQMLQNANLQMATYLSDKFPLLLSRGYQPLDLHLTRKDFRNIMTDFLAYTSPEHKDLFNQLDDEGRIFFLPKGSNWDSRGATFIDPVPNSDNFYMIIKGEENDLEVLNTAAHEMGHVIEIMKLREILSPRMFYYLQSSTFYNETESMFYTQEYFKYLKEIGINDESIRPLATNEILTTFTSLNEIYDCIVDGRNAHPGPIIEPFKYAYGGLISTYLANIEDKKLLEEAKKKFGKEKLTDQDIEIFERIGCTGDVLEESIEKQLKLCL